MAGRCCFTCIRRKENPMEDFVRNRITALRVSKGVSEYKMSYDLGHSRGYINNISSGKSLPSLTELFAICDYFGITVREFFNTESNNPMLVAEAVNMMNKLSDDDMKLTLAFLSRLNAEK